MADDPTPPRIYDLLVRDQDDFLGIMAYSIYKRQKTERIEAHCSQNSGKSPTQGQLADFYATARSETQQGLYREQALAMVNVFTGNVLEEKASELEQHYNELYQGRCEKLKPAFFFGVWQSVVGSFVFLLALGLIFFMVWTCRDGGVIPVLEKIFKIKISNAPP